MMDVPEKLKKNVRSVLLSSSKGVILKKFPGEYRSLVKEPFPWRSLGYSCAVDILKAMPDVVRFEYSNKAGDYLLYGIADPSCYLPSWLKKFKGTNNKPPSIPPPSTHHLHPKSNTLSMATAKHLSSLATTKHLSSLATTKKVVERRRDGLVTLYVGFKCGETSTTDNSPSTLAMMKRNLADALRVAGKPQSMYIDGKGFAFARFATLEEAERVIRLCDNIYVCQTRIVLRPARESEHLFTGKNDRDVGVGGKSQGGISLMSETSERGRRDDVKGEMMVKLPNTDLQSRSEGPCITWPDDVIDKSHDCHMTRELTPRSDSLSDSDSWDEELLNTPISTCSSMEQGPDRPVSIPSPQLEQKLELKYATAASNGLIPVYVSQVESHNCVWIELTSDPRHDTIKLSGHIANILPTKLIRVTEGDICCVRMSSDDGSHSYWRVKVVEMDNCITKQQVLVVMVDTGRFQIVPCSELHTLPPSLSLSAVPPLAMPCRLSGIYSLFHGENGYFLDNQLLWKLIMKKKVYVRKVASNQSSLSGGHHQPLQLLAVDMFLDVKGEDSVADILVEKGMYIQYNDDDMVTKKGGHSSDGRGGDKSSKATVYNNRDGDGRFSEIRAVNDIERGEGNMYRRSEDRYCGRTGFETMQKYVCVTNTTRQNPNHHIPPLLTEDNESCEHNSLPRGLPHDVITNRKSHSFSEKKRELVHSRAESQPPPLRINESFHVVPNPSCSPPLLSASPPLLVHSPSHNNHTPHTAPQPLTESPSAINSPSHNNHTPHTAPQPLTESPSAINSPSHNNHTPHTAPQPLTESPSAINSPSHNNHTPHTAPQPLTESPSAINSPSHNNHTPHTAPQPLTESPSAINSPSHNNHTPHTAPQPLTESPSAINSPSHNNHTPHTAPQPLTESPSAINSPSHNNHTPHTAPQPLTESPSAINSPSHNNHTPHTAPQPLTESPSAINSPSHNNHTPHTAPQPLTESPSAINSPYKRLQKILDTLQPDTTY